MSRGILRRVGLWAAFAAVPLAGSARAADRAEAEISSIAKAYGLGGFDKVEALRFTFHVRFGDRSIDRSWVWEPRTGRVSYKGPDAAGRPVEISYLRSDVEKSTDIRSVDGWFINDQYWLLFPLHMAWDKDARVTADGEQALPIGPGRAKRLTVAYPPMGGYTPGDVYEIFYGEDGRLRQWTFYRGGDRARPFPATWEDHVGVGPLLISLQHRNPGAGLHLWFTDAAMKTADHDGWQEALPPPAH